MERAQELRTMMKVGINGNGNASMSGKDKAKLLKMMKEQQKSKEIQSSTRPSKTTNNTVTKTSVEVNINNTTSNLPAGFFDDATISTSTHEIKKSTTTIPVPPPQKSTEITTSGISNLPQGFFDNPVEDLNARGITMEQYTAKMEKEEQAELDSFLTELKGKYILYIV